MKERDDFGYRHAPKVCKVLGHKWEDGDGRGNLRCSRCLRWKAGHPPHGNLSEDE